MGIAGLRIRNGYVESVVWGCSFELLCYIYGRTGRFSAVSGVFVQCRLYVKHCWFLSILDGAWCW